jgi:hypothetical protein
MDWNGVFGLANIVAMAGWVVLIAAPRQWPGAWALPRWVVPVALSAIYSCIVLVHFAAAGGGYGAIAEVRQLFQSDAMLVAGWTHYLAFDLLIGAWIAGRMDRAGVDRILQAGPLLCVFMFGPVGLLLGLMTEGVTRFLAARLPDAARVHWATVALSVALSVLYLPGLFLDARMVDGSGVWVKPMKFAISFILLSSTLALITTRMSPMAREGFWMRAAAAAIALGFVGEMAYMSVQAGLGEPSHFNVGTPYHAAMYTLMAAGATGIVLGIAIIGLCFWRDAGARSGAGLKLGVLLGLVGSTVLTLITAFYLGGNGGHFVGVPTADAAVIPLFGWSAQVGDLRPAHFLALHMMQAIPLLGLMLDRAAPLRAKAGVLAGSMIWTVLTFAIFAQAIVGLPLIRL